MLLPPSGGRLLSEILAALDPSGTVPLYRLLLHGSVGLKTSRLVMTPRAVHLVGEDAGGAGTGDGDAEGAGPGVCGDAGEGEPRGNEVEVKDISEPHLYSIIHGEDRKGSDGPEGERVPGVKGTRELADRDDNGDHRRHRHCLNLRASWLLGRPVYGRVLLTRCRASMNPQVSYVDPIQVTLKRK